MCATEAKLAVPEPVKAPTMNPPVTRAPVVKPAASAALGSSVPRPSAKAVVPGPPPAFPPAPVAPMVLAPLPPPPPPPPSGGPNDLVAAANKAYIDALQKYTDLLKAIEASGQAVGFSGQATSGSPPNSVPTVPVSAATPGPSAARADNPPNDPVM